MESANTLDVQALKALIKESVREVMREEWFKFFEMLTPYVDDAEQAEIEATFDPADYAEEDFVDVTGWFDDEKQAQSDEAATIKVTSILCKPVPRSN